jgi:hypothetical protein
MKSKPILLESHYLPNVQYFTQIIDSEVVWIEAHENYLKQSLRNRCYILAANKVDRLTIPVVHQKGVKIPIQEIQIDDSQKWQNKHWRAIQSAYAHAPFFEYYSDYFKKVIFEPESSLFQLNLNLLKTCLELLQIKKEIRLTNSFGVVDSEEKISDLRNTIQPNSETEIAFENYQQVFGEQFIPNLSILDLLFCEGPNASAILRKQYLSLENKAD